MCQLNFALICTQLKNIFHLTKSHNGGKRIGTFSYNTTNLLESFIDPSGVTVEVNRYVTDPL